MAKSIAEFEAVGKAFTQHYYSVFDTDRKNLAPLYRDASMLSFEGNQFLGTNAIIEKLASMPFHKVVHQIVTTDSQPTPVGIMVSVSGNMVVDDGTNPMKFAQMFHLIEENGNYWVQNDIFRLNLG